MGISSKIIWTLGGVLLMSSAFADQKDKEFVFPDPPFGKPSTTDVAKRLETVEQKLDQISEMKVSDVLGGNNPPVFACHGNTGFFTSMSFLYWTAYSYGWLPATETRLPVLTPSGNLYTNVASDELHFEWSPGARIGFGYNSGYDAWSVEGLYSWIRLRGSGNFTAKNFGTVSTAFGFVSLGIVPEPSFTMNRSFGYFNSLSARWSLNHQIGDLQFARDFFITKALGLQPILGVRFATLDQNMNAHFGQNLSATLNSYVSYHSSNNFWGVGPKIGIDGKWTLPRNVSFKGLISGSLLYGKTTVDEHLYAMPLNTQGLLETVGTERNKYDMLAPTLQLALGLDWGMYLNKEKMYLGVGLDWEFNYWWNQFHIDYDRDTQAGIEMQGVSLRADLHF